MRVVRFVSTTGVSWKRRDLLRLLCFVLVVGIIVFYVVIKWHELAPSLPFGRSVATLGNTGDSPRENFFVEFRLEREKIQKEQLDLVKKVMEDQNASKEIRDQAYRQYLALVDAMGKERKIEGILKAKGWESVVVLSASDCTVVVKAANLQPSEVAQIADAVRRVAKIAPENITIIPSP